MNDLQELVRVENLKKHFSVTKGLVLMRKIGAIRAVDGISFSINEGETLSLVGESGCGKSTTANLVLRLEYPTSGRVMINGSNIHNLRGKALQDYRMEVQAVFQDPWSSLNPRMRIRDFIAEPLRINQSLSQRDLYKKVEDILIQVGLRKEQANLFPHEFSGGQRQRIALASAFIAKPKLVVLDEPVSALDVSVQAQIMNLIKKIQKELKVAYLLVAHNLATVRYMAHTVAVMYLGEIVEISSTKELFNNPLHFYTKALFSAALPAHPDIKRNEIILKGEVPSPIDPPHGCRFHGRCAASEKKCATEKPVLKEIKPNHQVACHLC